LKIADLCPLPPAGFVICIGALLPETNPGEEEFLEEAFERERAARARIAANHRRHAGDVTADADAFFDVEAPAFNDVTGIPMAFARESYRIDGRLAGAAAAAGRGGGRGGGGGASGICLNGEIFARSSARCNATAIARRATFFIRAE